MKPTNNENVDLSPVFKYLPKRDHPEGEVGNFYNTDIPEELYHKLTYSLPPAQQSYQRPFIPINKDVDAISETVTHQKNVLKKKQASVASSPYDFRQSFEIPFESKPLATFDSQLQSKTTKEAPLFNDIKFVGKTAVFNQKLIGIRSSLKHQLPTPQPRSEVPIDEDQVIKEIAATETKYALRVFTTAKALAAIAVCPRSIYPFDLVFNKVGKDIYVKTRPGNQAAVLETTLETITTTIQVQRDKMSIEFTNNIIESTNVNNAFIQKSTEGQQPISIGEDSPQPLVYRSMILGDIEFIIRGEVDAIKEPPKENERPQILLCRVFNDIPSILRRNPWENLDVKRGAIFLSETNVNSSKVARWVAIAKFIGAQTCMIGYATRKVPSMKNQHVLLGVERHNTDTFAHNISLNNNNLYGILIEIFSRTKDLQSGSYIFLRESRQKKTYHIYANTDNSAKGQDK